MNVAGIQFQDLLTLEIKEQQWGPGEWVNEPDMFTFYHSGYNCCGIRVALWEGHSNDFLFGGYWCGYLKLPQGHPWHSKDSVDIPIDCHYGLTLCEKDPEGEDWVIGFDCAHSGDACPSEEKTRERFRKDPNFSWLTNDEEELKKKFPNSSLFNKEYRNIDYVIKQCRCMAEQAQSTRVAMDS